MEDEEKVKSTELEEDNTESGSEGTEDNIVEETKEHEEFENKALDSIITAIAEINSKIDKMFAELNNIIAVRAAQLSRLGETGTDDNKPISLIDTNKLVIGGI